MQAQRTQHSYDVTKRNRIGQQRKLLLVGSEDAFKREVRRIINEHQFRIADQSPTLLGGLARLESGKFDLVLLSDEFREQELYLFNFDAHRRGFPGLILRVVSMPREVMGVPSSARKEYSGRQLGQQRWGAGPPELSEGGLDERRRLSSRPAITNVRTSLDLNQPRGSISLTPKEEIVLTRVCEGWKNQQIARDLKCSEGSVKSTLQKLFKKLGVRTRAQVVRMAFENAFPHIQDVPPSSSLAVQMHDSGVPPVTGPGDEPQRRPETQLKETSPIQVGDFVVDEFNHRAWIRGFEEQFSPREFELLTFFSKHPEELMSHDNLLEMLWSNAAASRASLRVLIQALRAKIETTAPPRYIVTQRHFGYRFFPSPPAVA
jgi:DNA-binding response OmpR family regulator